jgi:hypothetical protein
MIELVRPHPIHKLGTREPFPVIRSPIAPE